VISVIKRSPACYRVYKREIVYHYFMDEIDLPRSVYQFIYIKASSNTLLTETEHGIH
jgi:hypothetical protein